MRKLFLLIPALILSVMVNAEPLGPNDPNVTVSNVIKNAVAAASADAVIELSDGIYKEDGNFVIDKNITIQAAEGAHPVIAQRYYIYFNNSAKVTIKGIKFDGGAYGDVGAYDYALRTYGTTVGDETLTVENCEFVNYPGYNIYIERADRGLDAITIRDCYFHNNAKYAIFIGKKDGDTKQSCNSLTIENSTFANVSGSYDVIYYDAPDEEHTTSLSVDHCTFYNHPKRGIYWQKSTNLTVSNCVFAQPSKNSYKSVECVGGTITNCLYYQSDGFSSAATRTNIIKGNPLFVDAANNIFRLNNASAARRENGTIWGDPRWKTATPAIAIPATLNAVDAYVSDSVGVRIRTSESAPDSIDFKMLGGSYDFEDMEWAKWKVSVSETGYYNFTAHVFRATSGDQKFEIKLLNSDETSELIANTDNNVSGGEGTISTGKYELTAGNEYVVKVRTLYNWAKSRVLFVDATYEGGALITVPDTLWPADAIRSEKAWVEYGTVDTLLFAPKGSEGHASDADYTIAGSQYGKWNIKVTKAGKYKFVANTRSLSGHNYRLLVYNADETVKLDSVQEVANDDYSYAKDDGSADVQISSNTIDLAAGQYIIKVQNKKNSKGRVTYVAASYEGGAVVNAPGEILAEEAVIFDNGKVKMSHDANGDLKYGNNSDPNGEYAYWNINATDAGEMAVSFNSPSGGHNFLFELYEGTTLRGSVSEAGTDAIWEHNVTLADHLTIPAAGTYTLRVHNRTQWSSAVLHSVTIVPYVAPAGVTMTDTDIDNSAWVANVGGAAVDVQMYRTILGGMYNTICLPFTLNSTKCKAIFGDDVELYTLGEATLSGDILNLQFNVADDIWKGTPILIKTSSTIVNPLFEGVEIESATADHTNRGIIDFRGTFVQTEFHNGDAVLLLLANDMLAYPQQNRTLKGFRAYFAVSGGAQVIKRARIVTPQNMPTEIDLVGAENQTLKTIENGQLIIFRDGKKYNVMGIRL